MLVLANMVVFFLILTYKMGRRRFLRNIFNCGLVCWS
jgi:hypothetical protein